MPLPSVQPVPANPVLARIVNDVNLPSLPATTLSILEKAGHPDCSLAEVARLVGRDPALCGQILKLVNSALFTAPRAVTSVERALSLLGLRRVRSLVLSLSLPALQRHIPAPQARDYWTASVATAIAGRELAARLGWPEPESELVAGLLCDLGVLILSELYPRDYARVWQHPPAVLARESCAIERSLLEVSHPEVGAYLLRRWHLPDDLTDAIACHHDPDRAAGLPAPVPERARLLHFAGRVAALQLAPEAAEVAGEVQTLAGQWFGMDRDELGQFLEPLTPRIEEFAALLKVPIGPCHNYAAVLTSATEQLTRLAVETSLDNLRIEQEKDRAERGREEAETALQRSQEQLLQAQKMEAIGRLAGGVAHDFNNFLTIINGYTEMLLNALGRQEALRAMVDQIRRAGERAAALTGQLLAFSRKQVLQPVVLDLNAAVAGVEKMLKRVIGEDVHLSHAFEPNLFPVKADPGQLDQILLNLVVNARDAMPRGGEVTIQTANAELGGSGADPPPDVAPGPYALLEVTDTGHGMDAATQARIFEPFFTTKEAGKGTGLGLATVYGIVKQSGGHITVHSEPGRGTTFRIYLPRVEAEVAAAPTGPTARPVPTGTETVLVAEDEDGLRILARKLLERMGYTVLEAKDGETALAVGGRHRGPVHLLLADVLMPGVNGPQLADCLVRERPDVRVLFMSGHTDEVLIPHGVRRRGAPLLQKPFSPAGLAHAVRDALDGPVYVAP
ncbi:MAG: HDOD domain-containing protein [Gemmataceae bacterium]|nr:HDOD domain-containing protein [Gemmataceae bacterium]